MFVEVARPNGRGFRKPGLGELLEMIFDSFTGVQIVIIYALSGIGVSWSGGFGGADEGGLRRAGGWLEVFGVVGAGGMWAGLRSVRC